MSNCPSDARPPLTGRHLLELALLLLAVRVVTVSAYRETVYFYGMVANQFAIADAAYRGHDFAWDTHLAGAAMDEVERSRRFLPLEQWDKLPRSGLYTTFPAEDVPGFAYIIASTSRWLGNSLTTTYAMIVQIFAEIGGLLLFVIAAARVFGPQTACLSGLLYACAYPFIWACASQPMRDVFNIPIFAATLLAACVCEREANIRGLARAGALLAFASLLLWVRPSAYFFPAFAATIIALSPRWSVKGRVCFALMALLVPWLVFGYPFRLFNLRHYGVADTDFLGRTLWEHMGVVKDNPYGFVQDDAALVPWVQRHYGKTVEYASPEMNHLLGTYARSVVLRDPAYYLKTRLYLLGKLATTPVDIIPPFEVVEFHSSGMFLLQYARSHPGSALFKVVNRVLLTAYFYLGIAVAIVLLVRTPARRSGLLLLLSPLLYTVLTVAWTDCEPRGMSTCAWVLLLPLAEALRAFPSHADRAPKSAHA